MFSIIPNLPSLVPELSIVLGITPSQRFILSSSKASGFSVRALPIFSIADAFAVASSSIAFALPFAFSISALANPCAIMRWVSASVSFFFV